MATKSKTVPANLIFKNKIRRKGRHSKSPNKQYKPKSHFA